MFPTYSMRLQNASLAEENIILLYKVQVLLNMFIEYKYQKVIDLCGNFTIYT